MRRNDDEPDAISPPGATLLDLLEECGMSSRAGKLFAIRSLEMARRWDLDDTASSSSLSPPPQRVREAGVRGLSFESESDPSSGLRPPSPRCGGEKELDRKTAFQSVSKDGDGEGPAVSSMLLRSRW